MLSFSTNLTNELRDRQASAYWYIKLYHGDESSFTGLSDSDRILDGVKYRGLVLGWGGWQHSANLNDFKPSTAALNNLTISNKDDAISGGRFSDLFATQNYTNRKFTLHMGAVGVAFADHEQIAQGIITDQAKHNTNALKLRLVEDISSVEKEIPTNRVNTTDHTNAPAKNIGKPIPISFGDFAQRTDIGTIPSSGAEFDRYFVKGYFPAIITDEWNDTTSKVIASPDAETLNALNDHHAAMSVNDYLAVDDDGSVVVDAAVPSISFSGGTWRVYINLLNHSTYSGQTNYAKGTDDDFDTLFNIGDKAAHDSVFGWKLGKLPNLGEVTTIKVLCDLNNFVGTPPNPIANANGFQIESDTSQSNESAITWNGGDQSIDISGWFTATQKSAWDFETDILMEVQDAGAQAEVDCYQVGVEITFTPSQTFTKQVASSKYIPGGVRRVGGILFQGQGRTVRILTDVNSPVIADYIYYSGKGREFGAWIDTIDSTARATITGETDPGYNEGALIENPVYMIEDILRTELSLDPTTIGADINIASFDVAGNTTDGTIKNTFDLAVGSIEFAFCQYKFANAWDFCQELARSCGCLLFFSGDGTIKIVARQKDEDYTSADRTIKFDELENVEPDKTSLAQVRNQVSVNYNMDYAQDVLTETTPAFSDGTSKGSGVQGINATQELIADNRFIIDDTTALAYATVLLDWLKYRKSILDFSVITPKHNDLEIADTIAFSGWPSTFKIYGNAVTATDVFMITKINKTPNGCKITCQKVSEVSD